MQVSIANIVGVSSGQTIVIVSTYVGRVRAAGGICEGVQCMTSKLQHLT